MVCAGWLVFHSYNIIWHLLYRIYRAEEWKGYSSWAENEIEIGGVGESLAQALRLKIDPYVCITHTQLNRKFCKYLYNIEYLLYSRGIDDEGLHIPYSVSCFGLGLRHVIYILYVYCVQNNMNRLYFIRYRVSNVYYLVVRTMKIRVLY